MVGSKASRLRHTLSDGKTTDVPLEFVFIENYMYGGDHTFGVLRNDDYYELADGDQHKSDDLFTSGIRFFGFMDACEAFWQLICKKKNIVIPDKPGIPNCSHASCIPTFDRQFDFHEALSMNRKQLKETWPPFKGRCKDCGKRVVAYHSQQHYSAWKTL